MAENHSSSAHPDDPNASSPDREEASPTSASNDITRTAFDQPSVGERLGPYRLLEKIGSGGMGEVYRAEQTEPIRRTVAIKIIKLGMDTTEVITRFQAERQALALMDHPNIAKVLDAGSTTSGRPFFVMEHVKGIPITTYADKHKLSTRQRLELFMKLCEGVQHAHQKAIIHRDLKPSNVLVTTLEDAPIPKIIDFGVAKATAQKLTEKTMYTAMGALIGTPEYMSPEQAEMTGEDIDTRTDVYSLGIILYELLTGSLPFEPKDLRKAGFEGIIRTIREQDPPRPSTRLATLGENARDVARARSVELDKLRNQLRGDLDWITMKALAKDRTHRYGSATEFAADLHRHLDHQPVLAGPPSAQYRMGKFVRRHRAGVLFTAVLITLLTGFAVTMALLAKRNAELRDLASKEAVRANQEAERANQEALAARGVTDFLVGLFDASDPRISLGETITAREIMDLGAERIEEGDVEEAPLQQARLLETMGRVYQNLSLYDRAGELLEKAVVVRRSEQGTRHPDVGRALSRLGWLRGAYQRNCKKARAPLLEAISILEEEYGPDHLETAWPLYYLGSALCFCQDSEGPKYLERARTIFEDTLGTESLPVSWCWNDQGNYFWDCGDYVQALESYQRAVTIKSAMLPSEHPDLATSLAAVGALLLKLERCDEAQPLVERALQSKLDTVGYNHDHTSGSYASRAKMYRCFGRYKAARQDAESALEIARATGKNTDYEIYALNELSCIEAESGNPAKSDSLFQEVLDLIARTHGSNSLIMAEILEERAASLRRLGREQDARDVENHVKKIRAVGPCRKDGI